MKQIIFEFDHVLFTLEFAQLVSVTGRSGMTSVAWILAVCFHVKPETDVVVKTGTDAEKVK